MKYIPIILLFVIILTSCHQVISTKIDNLCHLDSLPGLRKGDTIQLAIEGKYIGTEIIGNGHLTIDFIAIGKILCNSTSFKITDKDSIWVTRHHFYRMEDSSWLFRPLDCLIVPNDHKYHLIYIEKVDTFYTHLYPFRGYNIRGVYSRASLRLDSCLGKK